jgi:flagellar hook-associated protein 1 FlgK
MGIFDGLHIGYSGLNASQTGINTTSHNISNVETEGYTRQRINQKTNVPLHSLPGDSGSGVRVETINRIHDEFVYNRLKSSSAKLEYSETLRDNLQEITNYFPDLENSAIADDLRKFFVSWSNVAEFPNDDAQKVILAQTTETLARDIRNSREELVNLQARVDEQLTVAVDEVNKIAKEIADINKDINRIESTYEANANDLRDQRDRLELRLSKLIDSTVFKGKLSSDNSVDRALTDQGKDYNINIAGHNIVDGGTFHPLYMQSQAGTSNGKLTSVYFMDQDRKKVDLTPQIRGGKIGALIALRGDGVDEKGRATNSKIQNYIDSLDSFAKGLINGVNGVYAASPQDNITMNFAENLSDSVKLNDIEDIDIGSLDFVVYDKDGNEVSRRVVEIDEKTIINDPTDVETNSLIYKLNQDLDDNGNNSGGDDFDDLFEAKYLNGKLTLKPKVDGYLIAVEDHGTNLAGYTGVNRFFKGKDASDISLESLLRDDPSKIRADGAPIDGNNDVANKMVAFQFQEIGFDMPNGLKTSQTVEAFYRNLTSQIATDAADAGRNYDSSEILHKTVEAQFSSVSGVDLDEELISLMKYQTAYQANAKVISTIDRMMDALLGIKQ